MEVVRSLRLVVGAAAVLGALIFAGAHVGAASTRCALAPARVAFSGLDGRIWVANPNGSDRRRISRISGISPTWSPDGNQIAFRHMSPRGSDIYVVGEDGSGETNVTRAVDYDNWSPAWSPDGRLIAFSSARD